ncbi:MAG: class I SAM-dependent DNA methyltransferase, partial [Lentisphaerae bacterium]|nr:class I SAM-dependent DNA methyltransferase [Lentisphaerota bacterium]
GVDINPMSVELCKVSLWMEAMEPGKPLGFLDHHIKCGNSLLGTTPALLSRGIPDDAFNPIEGDDKTICSALKKRNKEERDAKFDDLFAHAEATWSYQHAFEDAVREVGSLLDEDIRSLEKKQLAYEEFLHSTSYTGGKRLHDAWCAAFVCPKVKDATTLTHQIVKEMQIDPNRCPKAQQELIDRLAAQYKFFHWHIEFPDVFQPLESFSKKDSKGWNGGFDCMLGNPPWERIKLQEKEWFAARDPAIATASNAAIRKRLIHALIENNPQLYAAFLDDKRQAEAESTFARNSGRFPLCGRGDVNTYTLFAETFKDCIAKAGRSGVIVPSGIATDDTTKFFFQNLVESKSLISLFDFENRRGIFPAVHSALKFSLLSMGGAGAMPSEGATVSFFALDVEDLKDNTRVFTLSADDIELINPNTRTCPIFRTRRDAELTKSIYRRVPVLIREARDDQPEQNPWGISFMRMFDMSNDSHLFHTREQLEQMGCMLEGNIFTPGNAEPQLGSVIPAELGLGAPGNSRFLPLYEAKMVWQFNHRASDYLDQAEGSKSTVLPEVSATRLADSNYEPLPRYWVSEFNIRGQLEGRWDKNWLLGWRDITNVTNERTTVSGIIPRYGCGDTWLLMFPSNVRQSLDACMLSASLNSYAGDYVCRQKVGGVHLKYHYFKQLAVLSPHQVEQSVKAFGCNALELFYTSNELGELGFDGGYNGPPFIWNEERRFEIRCELDAAFFHLYGIDNEDDVDYIMETFPIVKRKDEKQ